MAPLRHKVPKAWPDGMILTTGVRRAPIPPEHPTAAPKGLTVNKRMNIQPLHHTHHMRHMLHPYTPWNTSPWNTSLAAVSSSEPLCISPASSAVPPPPLPYDNPRRTNGHRTNIMLDRPHLAPAGLLFSSRKYRKGTLVFLAPRPPAPRSHTHTLRPPP